MTERHFQAFATENEATPVKPPQKKGCLPPTSRTKYWSILSVKTQEYDEAKNDETGQRITVLQQPLSFKVSPTSYFFD